MCTPHLYYTLSVIYPSHCCLLKFTAVTQSFDAQSILPHAVIKKLRCYEVKVEPSNAYFEGLLWTRKLSPGMLSIDTLAVRVRKLCCACKFSVKYVVFSEMVEDLENYRPVKI